MMGIINKKKDTNRLKNIIAKSKKLLHKSFIISMLKPLSNVIS